jgi:hypothetical protein
MISKAWPTSLVKVIKKNLPLRGKKHKFHWVHIVAVFILGGYFILSKINLTYALLNNNIIYSFAQIYLLGTFFACLFLFIFSHDKFFPVAKEIEKEESKKEKKYLGKYFHHGKIFATIVIGIIGGPVFSSLTARLLLNNTNFIKYIVVILANIPSTIITVGLANGFIKFLNF